MALENPTVGSGGFDAAKTVREKIFAIAAARCNLALASQARPATHNFSEVTEGNTASTLHRLPKLTG